MAAYKGSFQRIELLSRIVLWIITITLSVFLINLGDRILSDIDNWFQAPQIEEFQNTAELDKIAVKEAPFDKQLTALNETRYHVYTSLQTALRNYNSEKKSFENWMEARKTIGSPGEDIKIRSRADMLDKFRRVEEAWQIKLDSVDEEIREIGKEKDKLSLERQIIQDQDDKKYQSAYKKFSLKIFFFRMTFVLPILALAIFLFIRFKQSRFKPLIRGYIIFALYAFFVGLVPYLPSFGGYIRYTVGILLTVFAGYYVMKQLAAYTAKKREELQQSTEERVKKIEQETGIKAYKSHSCPSCEKDFLMNKWQPKTKILKDVVLEEEAPSYCQHCGLELFGKCGNCGTRNFIHFPFCSNCGSGRSQTSAKDPA